MGARTRDAGVLLGSAVASDVGQESPMKLQDAQLQGSKLQILTSMVQDAVTQQFLKMKESMNNEMQRCVQTLASKTQSCEELLQRLEGAQGRQSTVGSLKQDLDRQKAQIEEIIKGRLNVGAIQDQAQRERDEESAIIIDNMRQDMEVMRNQHRNSLSGNAATSEQQQRLEKEYLQMRQDLEAMTAENQRYRNVQAKMELSLSDMQKKIADSGSNSKQVQQISEMSQQLFAQRDRQSQLERVIMELRQEMQGASEEIEKLVAGLRHQQDRHKEHTEKFEEHHKNHHDLKSSIQDLWKTSQVAGEEAIADLKQQVEAGITNKKEQMLSASFGADIQARVEEIEEKVTRLQQEIELPNTHHKELAKTVGSESAARMELHQSVDAFRNSHVATASELREAVTVMQERVCILETVQLEDRGLRERTMEQMEVNLQGLINMSKLEHEARLQSDTDSARRNEELAELKRQFHAESAAHVDLTQSVEAVRSAYVQTSSDLQAKIAEVSENSGTIREFVDRYVQDLTRMVQEESEARLDFSRVFELHRNRSEEVFARITPLENQLLEAQQLIEGVCAEESATEALRAEYLSTRTELRAELELAMDKLTQLESFSEETDNRSGRAIEALETEQLQLRKVCTELQSDDSMRNETTALRNTLESLSRSVEALAGDLEAERSTRGQEASVLLDELQVLRLQQAQLEDMQRSNVEGLRSEVEIAKTEALEITRPTIESLKETIAVTTPAIETLKERIATVDGIKANADDVEAQKAAMAKENSQLLTGMKAMQEKIRTIESNIASVNSDDRSWRQTAAQDIEGILRETKLITPAAASTRTLPTLASALRQCKAELD